jgi:hypothetical protein
MLLPPDEGTPDHAVQLEDDVETFWKSLIFIMWLPVDVTQSPVKEMIYTGQAFVFLITASYYTSVNTVFVALIVQTAGQFEILLATIKHMDCAVRSQHLTPGAATEDRLNTLLRDGEGEGMKWLQQRDPRKLRPYFVAVIRHHQTIIA